MDTERAKDSPIINRIICKIVAGSTHWNAALLPSTTFYVPVSSETKKHPWEPWQLARSVFIAADEMAFQSSSMNQYNCRYVPFALLLVAFPTLILSKVKDASAEVFT